MNMVKEWILEEFKAIMKVEPKQLDQLLHPMIDTKLKLKAIAKGLPASPGAAVGKVVFTAEEAEEWVKKGEKVVLVLLETSPEDIGGMNVAEWILTACGGMTSHAGSRQSHGSFGPAREASRIFLLAILNVLAHSRGGPWDGQALCNGLRGLGGEGR